MSLRKSILLILYLLIFGIPGVEKFYYHQDNSSIESKSQQQPGKICYIQQTGIDERNYIYQIHHDFQKRIVIINIVSGNLSDIVNCFFKGVVFNPRMQHHHPNTVLTESGRIYSGIAESFLNYRLSVFRLSFNLTNYNVIEDYLATIKIKGQSDVKGAFFFMCHVNKRKSFKTVGQGRYQIFCRIGCVLFNKRHFFHFQNSFHIFHRYPLLKGHPFVNFVFYLKIAGSRNKIYSAPDFVPVESSVMMGEIHVSTWCIEVFCPVWQ